MSTLRGGNQKIDRSKIDQSGSSNVFTWSCLRSLNKIPFQDDSRGKSSPYQARTRISLKKATVKRGPEITGPRGQWPQGTHIATHTVSGFGELFLVLAHSSFYFLIFYKFTLFYFSAQGGGRGHSPRAPPPPDTSLGHTITR